MNDGFIKPLFIQRLGAFILDSMLIALLVSLIGGFFVDQKSINKIQEDMVQIQEKYINKDISTKTYLAESLSLSFQSAQKQGIVTLISIFLSIMYFIVYQFYNKGQTLGKKIFKIKVAKYGSGELTINSMIFRSLIINSIFVDMVIFAFVAISNFNMYRYGGVVFRGIDYFVSFTSLFMIMFSKSGRGIHDYIAGTIVVRADGVKERELCES